ncbi:hypothetical protein ScPMuIL_003646 [Solemya velum]
MKEREIDKDTVVAYHEYIQGRIQGMLSGLRFGPGRIYCDVAIGLFIFGVIAGIVGILVITLRFRHVYLPDWNDQFLGPFFVVLFIMCTGVAVLLVSLAHKRTNKYRRHLVFRPIGDYGVAVVHSSRLAYEEASKDELKSGTTPHKSSKPRPYVSNEPYGRTRKLDYENPAYRDDSNESRPPPAYDERRGPPRDDRRGPPRGPDDRRGPPRDPDDRRGPPRGPDDRRGPPRRPDDRRGPPRGPDDRRGPPRGPDERRGPPRGPDDRRGPPRGPDDRRGPPRGPDDRGRRPPPTEEERRRYEERRRRDEGRRYYDDEPGDKQREPGEKRPQGTGFKLVPDTEIQFRRPAHVDLKKELEEDSQI